ncbi:MAG: glycosyltransferase family 39 protein [Bauldia sp.]|nr:glycosyltransferase family 39 protein [Bauldia sp.]
MAGVRRLSWERLAFLLVAALTIARFVITPFVPLSFDEAYYWRWSQNLAFGYLDHPPLIAWIIRFGTGIFGDTLFGIRFVPLLGGVAATWAVWRAADILFKDRRLAALAAVFFSFTLIVSVGTILATPDAPLLAASAFLLLFLAKVLTTTGRPVWWIAAGAAVGIGCLAKFTAMFWLPSIFLWALLVPELRRQLRTPWPWAGAAVAALIYLPNFIWNAQNGWMTFIKQFGRVDDGNGLQLGYLAEHLGAQIGMSTLVVFFLGWIGLIAFLGGRGGTHGVRVLLSLMVWPATAYFIFHGLHARVEGNWTGLIFPAFSVAAAAAVLGIDWRGRTGWFVNRFAPLAIPVGIIFVVGIYAQALVGWAPLGASDPTASNIGAGMETVAAEVDAMRIAAGAEVVLTTGYALASWLSYYLPSRPPVLEPNEPDRWLQEEPPDPSVLDGPALAVVREGEGLRRLEELWGTATLIGSVVRRRGSLTIATYDVYRLPGPQVATR